MIIFDVTTVMAEKNHAALPVCAQTKDVFPFKMTTLNSVYLQKEPLIPSIAITGCPVTVYLSSLLTEHLNMAATRARLFYIFG